MNWNTKPVNRRQAIKGGIAAVSVSLVGFDQLFAYRDVFGKSAGDDIPTILNLAATAETLACTHYYNVLTISNIALTPSERSYFKATLSAELQHLAYLNDHGGKTLATQFYFPRNVYNNRTQYAQITEQSERVFVAAYLASVRRLAELGNPLLAATAAQIAAVEEVHLAIVRQIGGQVPNKISLAQPLIYNPSDALPVLQPFLEGGQNTDGPSSFPGAQAVQKFVGEEAVAAIQPFTDAKLFQQGAATVVAGPCTVTPMQKVAVNIRRGAGINFEIIGFLRPGTTMPVDGLADGTDNFKWYRLHGGGFVRSDVVSSQASCQELPAVSGALS